MFDKLVKRLTLDYTSITKYKVINDDLTICDLPLELGKALVEDFLVPINNDGSPFLPDYGIRGIFKLENKGQNKVFFMDKTGPDALFITGVPKSQDLSKFRLKDTVYVSYWEDNKIGYLTQVTNL